VTSRSCSLTDLPTPAGLEQRRPPGQSPLVYTRSPDKVWVYGGLRVADGTAVTCTAPARDSDGNQQFLGLVEQGGASQAACPLGVALTWSKQDSTWKPASSATAQLRKAPAVLPSLDANPHSGPLMGSELSSSSVALA
jgi:hypothetical protein